MPQVSVVVPVYNGEKTIFRTISSVLNQSLRDFEVIIINSGSTDQTAAELSHVDDLRVSVFNYPKALVSVNRNLGIKHSSGEFISFLDADDLWSIDKLESQLQTLIAYPDAGLVYSWTRCIDENDKVIRGCNDKNWSGDVLEHLLLDDFIGSGSNVMIRRHVLDNVGGFDETLTNAEDTDLWLRIAARYHFVAVPKAQVFYRISPSSKSSNVGLLEKANLKVIHKSFSTAPDSMQYLRRHRIANLYKYLTYRALEAEPGSQKALLILKFMLLAIVTDPKLFTKKALHKAWIKLLIMTFFSKKLSTKLLSDFPRLSATSTLLGYGKTSTTGL